jgi:putative hydrolase of the HAD superfamily
VRSFRPPGLCRSSSEVGELWDESPFAGRFDAIVLSANEGVSKPDPGIYRLALERLGVPASEAIFVGDGEAEELPGAEAVGMRAVQLGSRDGWPGERIDAFRELLSLL